MIILDYPGGLNISQGLGDKKTEEESGHSMREELNLPLLTLKREKETSYNSRNVGHIQKLGKARKHVLP